MLYPRPARQRRRLSLIEKLETRRLLSLVVDLRLPGGGKSATVTGVGQVIKLEAWATVKGSNTTASDDGVQDVYGSFVSSLVSGGASGGTLKATRTAPFNGTASSDGQQKDLNGDGYLDVGSNTASSSYGYFLARSNTMTKTGGVVSGGAQSFKIADLTYTVTSLKSGQQTNIGFVPRANITTLPANVTAVWMQDNVRISTYLSTNTAKGYSAGAPVVLKRGTSGTTPGSIAGNVWKDANANGVKDSGEANFAGFRLYIDANRNNVFESTERSTYTDSNGNYVFGSLPANSTYLVRPLPPSGWSTSYPSVKYWDVSLGSGQNVTGKNFGERSTTVSSPGSIAGNVWKDANGNGVKETGEANYSGFRLYIDANKNNVFESTERSTYADSSGNYKFSSLPAGTSYRVRPLPPSGWRTSSPSLKYYDVTLSSGQNATGKNFGETQYAAITGTVFNDANGDKIRNSGETGLSAWRIYIDSNNNGKFDSTERSALTDSSGNYSLSLPAGSYLVRVVVQSGWKTTTALPSSFTLGNAQTRSGLLFGEKRI